METDLFADDLNLDGWVDVVVARKQPFTTPGKRSNRLLMNWSGIPTDESALYTNASDVPGDGGFATPTNDRDVVAADLDGDGWPDSVHADVDVLTSGYDRRMHVYRNPGGVPGEQITLVEERELPGTNQGPGWLGAVGLRLEDLQGTHDFSAQDFDNDGDLDLLVSRYNGTEYYEQVPAGAPPACGHTPYGPGATGSNQATLASGAAPVVGTTVPFDVADNPS